MRLPTRLDRFMIAVQVVALALFLAPVSFCQSPPRTDFALNVRAFGALGDGTTDDTKAFRAALDALGPRGGLIEIPPGTYRCNLELSRSGITLRGAGMRASILTPAAKAPVVTIGNPTKSIQGCGLENLGIEGPAGAGPAVLFTDTTQINDWHRLSNLWIGGFDTGIAIRGRTIWSRFEFLQIAGCRGSGISITGPKANPVNFLTFSHVAVNTCGDHGVYLKAPAGLTYKAITFEALNVEMCGLNPDLVAGAGLFLDGVEECMITGGYFENNCIKGRAGDGAGIRITGTHGMAINILGNLVWGSPVAIANDATLTQGLYAGNRLAGGHLTLQISTGHPNSRIIIQGNYDDGKHEIKGNVHQEITP